MLEATKMLRATFKKMDEERDEGLGVPKGLSIKANIAYGPDLLNVLDVYLPADAIGLSPVIISVHGGAWVYGDKEHYAHYCMDLAARGFAVVNFSYRLAPEHPFPAQLEDTCSVFAWTLTHAADYGIDSTRIFAVGDSCGAHILGLFCNLCTNPAYASRFAFKAPVGFVPRGVALNTGCYRFNFDNGPDEPTVLVIKDIMPNGGNDEELSMGNVLDHATEAFPPAFITTAPQDFLMYQALPFAARLQELNVSHVMRYYADPYKSLMHVFHLDVRNPWARLCTDEECAFFRGLC